MKELVDKIIECEMDNIPFSTFPKDERFGLIVYKNNVKYEFLIHLKSSSPNLICLGSGALNGADLERFRQKPRFHRQSWKIKESTLFYNDPTRYIKDSLLGGWGVGTPDDWYLETIKDIIVKIADYNKTEHENILFYGSSLGGFTSIQLATLVRNSKALADVPQLTLENAKYFKLITPTLFPDMSDEEINDNYSYRLNILDLIEKEKYIPNAVLIFDAGEVDITEHYTHFFSQLNKLTASDNANRIKIIINPINEHKFLRMDESLEIIQQACDNDLMCFGWDVNNSNIFKNLQKLNEDNLQKDKEIQNLKKQKDEEIVQLKHEKNQEIANLNAKYQEMEHKFNTISNSTIWRLTKPLRNFLDLFKK